VRLPNAPVLATIEENPSERIDMLITALTAVAACVAVTNCPAAAGTIPRGADTCFGQRATLLGTAADEDFVGTQGVDVIVAAGGNDTIVDLGGDDLLCGGPDATRSTAARASSVGPVTTGSTEAQDEICSWDIPVAT
jgi:hypothetical protein